MKMKTYSYIWVFFVKREQLEEFRKAYGSEGVWNQLFRQANGYIATDLHQDIKNPKRYITVNIWQTKNDKDNFLNQYSEQYKLLDQQCEHLTEKEKYLGDFNAFTNRFST